jgi:hypothetical protein
VNSPKSQNGASNNIVIFSVVRAPRTSSTKRRKGGEIAAKAVVQLLFATGKSFTVDGLREKREFFRQEVRPELRAVTPLNNVELLPRSFLSTGSSALTAFSCGFSTEWFRC